MIAIDGGMMSSSVSAAAVLPVHVSSEVFLWRRKVGAAAIGKRQIGATGVSVNLRLGASLRDPSFACPSTRRVLDTTDVQTTVSM